MTASCHHGDVRYIDWCDTVWLALGRMYEADKVNARYGMSTLQIAEAVGLPGMANQPGFTDGPLWEAIHDALDDLNRLGLTDANQWHVKLTDLGRKGRGHPLRGTWRQIHREVDIEPDAEAFLRKSIELGEVEDDASARHVWQQASDLFAAMGLDWDMGAAHSVTDDLASAGCIVSLPTMGAVRFHNTYVGLVKMTTPATEPFVPRERVPGEPQVLISYAHNDVDIARVVAVGLQDEGCGVWLDEGELRGGDSLIERVTEAAYNADFVVALVSDHSVASNWCRKELAVAMTGELADRGVMVVPLRIGDVAMPPTLVDKVYRRVDPARPEDVLPVLLADIRSHVMDKQDR